MKASFLFSILIFVNLFIFCNSFSLNYSQKGRLLCSNVNDKINYVYGILITNNEIKFSLN